jgi:hypothetical protein
LTLVALLFALPADARPFARFASNHPRLVAALHPFRLLAPRRAVDRPRLLMAGPGPQPWHGPNPSPRPGPYGPNPRPWNPIPWIQPWVQPTQQVNPWTPNSSMYILDQTGRPMVNPQTGAPYPNPYFRGGYGVARAARYGFIPIPPRLIIGVIQALIQINPIGRWRDRPHLAPVVTPPGPVIVPPSVPCAPLAPAGVPRPPCCPNGRCPLIR